ncbi:MAG: o-succinylbenzoate--CoA ligase [Betaproteobacteria bacterium]|nr:o-succinylbenzoate--CoA ligase [Betaproteobacteria bacterium]
MAQQMSFEPLTPTAFLKRSALVFGDRIAVIDGERRFTYSEFYRRALQFAGALRAIGGGDRARVAVLAPNTHMLLEAHYGVPLAGAVLVALNQRFTASDLTYAIRHSDAHVLIYDAEFESVAREIANAIGGKLKLVRAGGDDEYERWLAAATPHAEPVIDERGMISINYTSGTTGQPKGVMYHHRGAYLQALAMVAHMRLDSSSTYLWTLPMFHCNGWCFTWGVTAAGATHLCLRKLDAALIWRHLRESGVTHFCAAPTVLIMIAWAEQAKQGRLARVVQAGTGGAPPTPAILTRMAELGIDVTHLYGLTETFGPAVLCEWRDEWNKQTVVAQGRIKARQGVGNVIAQELRIVDIDGRDVPADGETMGEIALRGNNVMLGYYRDDEATQRAAPDGWFRTGDLGVMHPDHYIEIKDRSKDIIVSGGENIASLEVERALAAHAAVMEAAVVAGPDLKWGEVPVAYVTLKPGAAATEAELIAHVRDLLAHFKAPKKVVFGELPKNATGKIQKFVLRERAKRQD